MNIIHKMIINKAVDVVISGIDKIPEGENDLKTYINLFNSGLFVERNKAVLNFKAVAKIILNKVKEL